MVSLSELDTQRFGIKSARANDIKAEDVLDMEAFCRKENVEFLIARCDTKDIQAVHALENSGHRLMDTLVYYTFDLQKKDVPGVTSEIFHIRSFNKQDKAQLEQIAAEAFADYADGHYHNDLRLDKKKCAEVYVDWIRHLCLEEQEKIMILVAQDKTKIIGFLAMQRQDKSIGEIVLNAVSTEYQRRGVYKQLVEASITHARTNRLSQIIVSTQFTNLAVQKVWIRLGFEPVKSVYTFHKWFT